MCSDLSHPIESLRWVTSRGIRRLFKKMTYILAHARIGNASLCISCVDTAAKSGFLATISSDSFTILGLWVLGLAVSHICESNCKLINPEHFFYDKSAIPLHPGTRFNKNFAPQRQDAGCTGNKITAISHYVNFLKGYSFKIGGYN